MFAQFARARAHPAAQAAARANRGAAVRRITASATAAQSAPAAAAAAAAAATAAAAPSSSPILGSAYSYPPLPFRPSASSPILAADLRSSFLDFFRGQGHTILPSASLVPSAGDDSLLFTNAGMVPLKDMLLGLAPPPPGSGGRIASVQKCIRAGGKHNDLENVGHTARHHTFFEMLGNFSVGAYFKEEAMLYAWRYLTQTLGLPPARLRITVLHNDDESARLWERLTGFRESQGQIVRMGESDNFWSMGHDPGTPCGPCSEIFWDQGADVDGERFLEIWNLVFMQFARTPAANGQPAGLAPLARPCVDTGMGLERIASVMQNQPTNYDSDLLRPLIAAVEALVASRSSKTSPLLLHPYTHGLDVSSSNTALKVIVDHLRSSAFLIAEGVVPSNVGRGYVLRRIIRRAVRYGYSALGLKGPFLSELVDSLVASMGAAYPELGERAPAIRAILAQEEANFFLTLVRGMKVLEEAFARHSGSASSSGKQPTLPGDVAFLLYDSFGFPLDLVELISRERGWVVDNARFEEMMSKQKEMSKGAAFQVSSGSHAASSAAAADSAAATGPAPAVPLPSEVRKWQHSSLSTSFTGFSSLVSSDSKVIAVHHEALSGESWIALDHSPFYANAGGQVGDIGSIEFEAQGEQQSTVTLQVIDCVKAFEGCSVLRVSVPESLRATVASVLKPGFAIKSARVDRKHREAVAIHHTATHLLHAALKAVLPALSAADAAAASAAASSSAAAKKKTSASAPVLTASSINQSGSLVSADRLRFDFSCPAALSAAQIAAVESWVNEAILAASATKDDEPVAQASGLVKTEVMSKEDAMKLNAMALFGEKYGNSVRVVSIPGYSVELCGGTHASSVRSVYPFKILSEAGIATGMRRLEAVAGTAAVRMMDASHASLRKLAAELKSTPEQAVAALTKLRARATDLEAQLHAAKKAALLGSSTAMPLRSTRFVLAASTPAGAPRDLPAHIHSLSAEVAQDGVMLRDLASALDQRDPAAVHVLLCAENGSVAVAVSSALKDVTAKAVFARLQSSFVKQGAASAGKGGGSNQLAIGVLPTQFAEPAELSLTERVERALQDHTIAPSAKAK